MIKSLKQYEKISNIAREDVYKKIFDKDELMFCEIATVNKDENGVVTLSNITNNFVVKVVDKKPFKNSKTEYYIVITSNTSYPLLKDFTNNGKRYIIKKLQNKLENNTVSYKEILNYEKMYKKKKDVIGLKEKTLLK